MEKGTVTLLGGFKLKREAAIELHDLVKEGRAERFIPKSTLFREALPRGFVFGFTFSECDLEAFLKWAAKAAEPGEVLLLRWKSGPEELPLFGYRVLEDGRLEPLLGALVDREGRVAKTLPHPEKAMAKPG